MSSAKWQPFYRYLNVLRDITISTSFTWVLYIIISYNFIINSFKAGHNQFVFSVILCLKKLLLTDKDEI